MIQVEKKTSLGKRVAVWTIAVLMTVSTVIIFASIIVSGQNAERDQARIEEATAEMEELLELRNEQVMELGRALSREHAPKFAEFRSQVSEFGEIPELRTEDLVVGDGEEIVDGVEYSAYYIGFRNDGFVFDSSFRDFDAELGEDNSEFLMVPLSATGGGGGLIPGWVEGVAGMRMGGVRKISIPSELAYGDAAQNDIPADSDLTFIVMMIPRIEHIPFDDRLVDLCIMAYSEFAEEYGAEYIEMVCRQEYGNGMEIDFDLI